MTEDRMALIEAIQKADDGNFLRTLAEAVLQIIMCIGLDLIGQSSDLGVCLRASDGSAQQATATGWVC
jgi:hypothetical protein